MTRIIAGRYGGRKLAVPAGTRTRPTADRVREALFSSLATQVELDGASVLDLYAGSGAVGLEAASRGAARVLLVESDPAAVRAARANIDALRAGAVVAQATGRVEAVLAGAPPGGAGYEVVFADPPYDLPEPGLRAVLAALAGRGWLAPAAVLALERSRRAPEPDWVPGITGTRSRRYGETVLWYGRADSVGVPPGT